MKEQIKKIIFTILNKEPEKVTSEELDFLLNHITYEMLEEYQQITGEAILIDGFNCEAESEEVINISAMDLLNIAKYLEN
jgi:ATP-dependent helicase/DNAse subunit B